jgi:hypothetical protein
MGCGNKNSNQDGGSTIEFTKAALSSLPTIISTQTSSQGLTAQLGSLASALSTGTIADYQSLVYLFKFECHAVPYANYCPSSIVPTTDLMDPYRFEMGSLIGMIFGAQMYAGSLVTSCSNSGLTPMTVTAGSYTAASSATEADPTRFILDNFSLYTCRSSNVSDAKAETRVLSAVADGSYQAALHTRYKYNSGDNRLQTDFFQVYVAMNGTVPAFLAFNFSAAEPHTSRVVLLTNLINHTFALKYYVPPQSDPNQPQLPPSQVFYAVATGAAGYDLATGTPYPGHYYVTFSDGGGSSFCVNNEGGIIESDDTNCTGSSVPLTWSTSDTIKAYLGISDADAVRVAPFLAKFQDNTALLPTDAWQNAGDEDLYWPASLQ